MKQSEEFRHFSLAPLQLFPTLIMFLKPFFLLVCMISEPPLMDHTEILDAVEQQGLVGESGRERVQ